MTRVADAHAPLRARSKPFGVVIVDSEEERARDLARRLHSSGCFLIEVLSPSMDNAGQRLRDADVAFVELGSLHGNGLTWANGLAQHGAEIVFFSVARDNAEVAAALSVGITLVIPVGALKEWAALAAPHLARCARARRDLANARASVPSPPSWCDRVHENPIVPLSRAEQLFRATYLERLLADFPNRKMAASKAGIPYRTLCAMLQKLGVS